MSTLLIRALSELPTALRSRVELDPMGEALVADSRDRQSTPLSRRERIVTWISGGLFLGAAIPMAVMVPSDRSPSLAATVAVITVYAVLSRVKFEVGSGWAVPTELVLVPMLFVFPPGSVPIFVALSYALAYLPDYLRGRTHGERAAVVLSDSWFAVGPALVFVLAGEPTASLAVWPILIAAVAAQFTLDIASSTAREWLAFRVRPGVLLGPMGWIFMVDVLLAPVGFLAALADTDNPAAYLLALPLAGLLAIFSRDRQVRIDQTLELSKTYRGTAFLLGDVVEADDDYTGLHSRDVVELVLEVCEELGLDGRERRRAEFAALLHDVGKIRIPKEIINKTGTLSAEERELMETHTIEGQRVLDRVGGVLSEIGSIVRSCHERFDGQGYPDGLAGDEIPILARIICCCDAFSAMTTDRSYRAARSLSAAVGELRQHAGTQFDPEVAEALARVVLRRASRVVEHEAGEIAGRNPSPIAGTRTIPLWRDDKPPVPTDDDPEVSSTAATRSAHAQSEGEARLAGSFGSSARVDARSDRPRRLHLRNSLVGDDLRARQAPSVENEHIKSSETNEPGASRSSEGARLAPVVVPVTLVGVGVGALAVWSLASSPPTIFGFIGIVALLLAATCAEALPVPIQNVQADGASMAAVFLVGTAVIFGWEASALASALTQVFLASRLRRRAARSAYNAAMYGLSGAAAGAAASAIAHTGSTVSSTVLGVIAASASFYAVNVALVTLVVARSSGEPLGSVLRRAVPITAVIFAIMTSAILMLVILWQRSPLLLIVLIGPLLAIGLYQRSLDQAFKATQLALTDPLTGLGNSRHFRERLLQRVESADERDDLLTLCLLDLDDFKEINDGHGHQAGDAALVRVAACIALEGEAFRIGGDEFALLLPARGPVAGAAAAEEVARSVARTAWEHGTRVTISAGVATFPTHGFQPGELVRSADSALYRAKEEGKDAVRVATSDGLSSTPVAETVAVRGQAPDRRGLI